MDSKKLRIAIMLPGTIDKGLFSSERGESRWAQNLSYILAANGFKVTCIGGPSTPCDIGLDTSDIEIMGGEGLSKSILDSNTRDNVSFKQMHTARKESETNPFDIVFDSCWFHPGMTEFYNSFNSKIFIHGHWGGCCLEEPGRYPNSSHILAYPNLESSMAGCARKHNHLFTPIPFVFNFSNQGIVRDSVVWGVKDCFLNRRSVHDKDKAKRLVDVFVNYVKERVAGKAYILGRDGLTDQVSNDLAYSNYALAKFRELGDKAVFVPSRSHYLVIQYILSSSRISFRSGEPMSAPFEYEAILNGCFPLVWSMGNPSLSRYYAAGGSLLTDDSSYEQIWDVVCRLDNKLDGDLMHMCKAELSLYTDYNFIIKQLLSVLGDSDNE